MRLCYGCNFPSSVLNSFLTFNLVHMAFFWSQNVSNGILHKSWLLYCGKRAGKLVKLRVTRRQQICVVQSREINRTKVLSYIFKKLITRQTVLRELACKNHKMCGRYEKLKVLQFPSILYIL